MATALVGSKVFQSFGFRLFNPAPLKLCNGEIVNWS